MQAKIDSLDVQSVSGRAVDIAQGVLIGVVESLFNVVLVIVVSVYMLLDAPRLSRFLRRLFPPDESGDDLIDRCERALIAYVRGQTLVCLVIGTTAGLLMWVLGVTGIFHNGDDYAIAFGAFVAVVEVIPYVGPWIGAIPPMAVALAESPSAAIAVALAFLVHPPGRGAHRDPQTDGRRRRRAPAAGDLRAAGGRAAVRPSRACS